MTPTPVVDMGGMVAGISYVVAGDPTLMIILTAAAISGLAFMLVQRGKRVAK